MIRSSAHSLRFTNPGKVQLVGELIGEYRLFTQQIINDIWENGFSTWGVHPSSNRLDFKGKSLLPTKYLKQFPTEMSARLQQAAGKQAIMMLKAATEKRRKQLFVLANLQREGGKYKRLQSKIDQQPLVKPNASGIKLELDSRFVGFQETDLFLFVQLSSLGTPYIRIPIKRTRCSNKWQTKGILKVCVRISEDTLHLVYEVPNKNASGSQVVGADQGITTALTLSNGATTLSCPHGHNLQTIQAKLARKQKGSNGFRCAQEHRKNYIHWSLNQLNFKDVREVRFEKIKHLRLSKRSSRYMSHWRYTLIKDKLVRLSEEEGFLFREVANEFRSQRCSLCGWVRKSNRKGKTFKCGKCGFTTDADLNAASNLKLGLFEIPWWVRLSQINRKGFFWTSDGLFDEGRESIVPATIKDNESKKLLQHC